MRGAAFHPDEFNRLNYTGLSRRLIVACVLLLAIATHARAMNLRLRVAWGGGVSRQWQGSLTAQYGSFSQLSYLGLDANETATIYLDNNTVHIAQRSARDYDGFDIQVSGSSQTTLALELAPVAKPNERHEVDVPLEKLITGYRHVQLDDQGNQILIQRVNGDRLRTKFDRSSLVFSTGESFRFEVEPHQTGLTDRSNLQCRIELFGHEDEDPVWEEQHPLVPESDEGGLQSIGPIVVPLPDREGVYRIGISVFRKRFRNTFMQSAPLLEREIQLVAIDDEVPGHSPSSPASWELVDTITPNQASWMEWLTKVPKLPLLPDFQQQPLGNEQSKVRQHLGRELVELAPRGWQAYPTATEAIGKPHIIEVEYPSDLSQTLGISVLETNAVGKVVPLGLDSGVNVTDDTSTDPPRMLRHRLVFWPTTSAPLVLLTNQRTNQPAVFGKIRVYAGPESLPQSDHALSRSSESSRLLAAYFDRPFFPENFTAPEAADTWSGRSLKDWVTFHEGGRRLVEYLKYVGYNGAIISVASQGGTIYPSRWLDSNPKYDTGTFFASGQDPVRKDILEMLFRLFDRAGLTLIPSVHFSSTLEELERPLRENPAEARGIALVNRQGNAWREGHETERGMGPHYNPLDNRVQTAMHHVLNEITERYGNHRSFGGLGLQLSPQTYSILPGKRWGVDDITRRQFKRDQKMLPNGQGGETVFRSREDERAWLHWRARVLADFHHEVLDNLQRAREDARLYLLGGDLFTNPLIQPMLKPTLPNRLRVDEALLHMGLSAEHYAEQNEIVFFRPRRVAPRHPLAKQAININLATNPAADQAFSEFDPPASLFYHERRMLSLPSFNAQSPFGQENTHTVLFTQATPSAIQNRQRFIHQLALRDVQYFADGGRMLALGQEESVQDLFKTLSQLPDCKFNTVTAQTTTLPTQPLVVRTLVQEGNTYLYAVNDSPWRVTAEIDIQAPQQCKLQAVGTRQLTPPTWLDDQMTWSLDLEPFDLAAAVLSTDQAEVETWRVSVDRATYTKLRRKVEELKGRVLKLQQSTPLHTLTNPSFEAATERLTGWTSSPKDGVTIDSDAETAFDGEQSLKIASEGPVAWVRSDPFDPPKTGRIAVVVRLRLDDPQNQPPLRLAIDGKFSDGSPYYVPFNVGQNSNVTPIDHNWGDKPYVLLISDLPADELVNIRVGFDLMGAGTIWIDDVHIHDRWFPKHEQDDLMIMRGLAARSLSMGRLADCRRILNGYWAEFLMKHISPQTARMAQAPDSAPARSGSSFPPPQPQTAPKPPSMLEKVRKRLPTKVFPFRLR